jgi:hypothetical protein
MSGKAYAFDRGGPARLLIWWRGTWRDTHVRVDGENLGAIADRQELEAGREFPLPTGGVLKIQLVRGLTGPELQVTRDGIALPGSSSDPDERIKQATHALYFVAIASAAVGLLSDLEGSNLLRPMGFGWHNIVEGAIFALAAWRTSKRSRLALALGLVLLGADTIAATIGPLLSRHEPSVGGIFVRAILIAWLLKGFQGMRGPSVCAPLKVGSS